RKRWSRRPRLASSCRVPRWRRRWREDRRGRAGPYRAAPGGAVRHARPRGGGRRRQSSHRGRHQPRGVAAPRRARAARGRAAGAGLVIDDGFFLGLWPERVLVGRIFRDLRRYPKIVGGTSEESGRRAMAFYRAVLDEGTEVRAVANAETAEMTKLAETTYRDVNIALANEYARYAARRGIDVLEVIGAANSQ